MHQSSTYFGGFPAETGQYCFAEAQINFKFCIGFTDTGYVDFNLI